MAKKIVKKAAAKKSAKAPAKKTAAKKAVVKKPSAKKVVTKKIAKKIAKAVSPKIKKAAVKPASTVGKKVVKNTITKTPISDKELETRQANLIANTEKKKAPGKTKRPKKESTPKQTNSLLDAIVDGMQEKKAKNIVVIDLTSIENRVSDYFVVCDAESRTQVEAIAASVEDEVHNQTKEQSYHSEGYGNAEWIIIDYINIVAHVFQKEIRDYYNIEALWADAEFKEIN